MSSLSRSRTPQTERLLEGSHNEQSLTTMDTQTKVTNSPLASGNPTPAPCAQCTNTQSTNTSVQLAHLAQSGHVLVSAARPTHALVHGPALSTVLEAYPHKSGTSVPHPGLLGTSSLRAVHTLPRSGEQSLNPKYRPILVAGNPAAFGRIASVHDAHTVHMLAHTSQAGGTSATGQTQPHSSQQSIAVVKAGTVPSSGNVVVAGLITPDGSVGGSSAARIAQLLTPSGGIANTPVMLYYPQTVLPGGKTTPSSNEDVFQGSQPSTTGVASPSPQQQPTVYYAVATSDLLRQLQASHPTSHEPHLSPQLIQTPSGLVLVQQPTQQSQHSINQTSHSQPQQPLSQPQSQQHQSTQHTLSQVPMHSSLTNSLKLSTSPVVNSLSHTMVESATLPRQSRTESGSQQSGLICTCPPEVHQALFEQQRRQKQAQQHHVTRTTSQDRQQPTHQQQSWPSKPSASITEVSTVNKYQPKHVENGCVSRICPDASSTAQTTIVTSPCCTAAQAENAHSANHADLSSEEQAEKEAHVNYLITLFQALRASGVQPDSFLVALQRTDLPIPTTDSWSKHRYALLTQNKMRLDECRRTLIAIRHLHKQFKQKITEDLQRCRDTVTHAIHQYKSTILVPVDPSLQAVRSDRTSLDRLLVELNESKASLAEQLHDLECVIEQTGNDVLQHRCRITVPYVQTLDSRLDSINRAVSSTCALYPELRQRIHNQEEAELRAIDVEKRLLDDHVHQLEDIGEKCKRIKGTIMTLRRLAIVNVQNRQQASSPRRFAHLGGVLNRAAADPQSLERTRLYMSVKAIQPNSEKRMQAIQQQETLAKQRKRVLALESHREANVLRDSLHGSKVLVSPSDNIQKILNMVKQPQSQQTLQQVPPSGKPSVSNAASNTEIKQNVSNGSVNRVPGSASTAVTKEEKKAPLAVYSDDSLSSTTTNGSTGAHESWNLDTSKVPKFATPFNPSSVVSMIDETSDSTLESQPTPIPAGILKSIVQSNGGVKSPKQLNRSTGRSSRAVMFNTTVTVDDGSEVLRLNCTLDESELGKNRVAPTEKQISPILSNISTDKTPRVRITPDRTTSGKAATKVSSVTPKSGVNVTSRTSPDTVQDTRSRSPNQSNPDDLLTSTTEPSPRDLRAAENVGTAPAPPPRRSSQISNSTVDLETTGLKPPSVKKKEYENLDELQSPSTTKRMIPLTTPSEMNPAFGATND